MYRYLLLFFSLSQLVFSQSKAITIDGKFDDWTSDLQTYYDTSETLDGLDLIEFQVTNDEDFLYIHIKTDQEFDLTETTPISHEFYLFLDTDTNLSTGLRVRDDFGAELGISFSERVLYSSFNGTTSSQVLFSDIQFRSAPTVTSNEYEFAIGRDVFPDGTNALFRGSSVNILLRNIDNLDWLPNENNSFTYSFDETPVESFTPTDLTKTNDDFIRVMAYNTLQNGLLDNNKLDEFERIMKSLQPDIVGMVESYDTSTSYIKSLFDAWLPLENTNGWYVEKLGGNVTASRWEIIETWPTLTRQLPVLIDLPDSYGNDLLYTNSHLSCCDADDNRQNQVDQYASFILDAKSSGGSIDLPENTPIIYSGDLNLVGLSQQLTTLVTGDIQNTAVYGNGGPLDWDDSDFHEENALQADKRMNYTWRSDNSTYPVGKLDFIIFSDYTLTSEKSFVLQTEVMSTQRLTEYGLNQNDTSTASDHFPVITDFSINQDVLSTEENEILVNAAYPNPTDKVLQLSLKNTDNYTINMFNLLGKNVLSTKVNANSLELNLEFLASGLYQVVVQDSKGNQEFIKIIKK